jgi:hypothetical protein
MKKMRNGIAVLRGVIADERETQSLREAALAESERLARILAAKRAGKRITVLA